MPKAKRLQEGYLAMLTQAKATRVIVDFADLSDCIQRNAVSRARDVGMCVWVIGSPW